MGIVFGTQLVAMIINRALSVLIFNILSIVNCTLNGKRQDVIKDFWNEWHRCESQ